MKKLLTLLLMTIAGLAYAGPISNLDFTPDDRYDIGTHTKRPHVIYVGTGGIEENNSTHFHTQVALTAANMIAMYTTPVVLVAAPGTGKSIVVRKLAFTITRTATAFTGGGAVIVQYDSTANGAGTQSLDSTIASTVVTGSAATTVTLRNGAVISDLASTSIQNKGLYISNDTAVFAAGTGTAKVDVWYDVY